MSQLKGHSLDLSRAPPVIYLFGLAGAGKNYVGDLIAEHSDFYVHHADSDLTDRMRAALSSKQHFTIEMLDEYFAIVAERIIALRELHSRLVVTQATYRIRHREYLLMKVPQMDLVWIDADDETIMRRLLRRGDSVTPEYALQMRAYFEAPAPHEKMIANVSDSQSVISQLNRLYGRPGSSKNVVRGDAHSEI